jgi:hypothetical protein
MNSQATPETEVSQRPATSRYADWKAPDEDGQFLIWPAADEVLRQTADNHRRLSAAQVLIQGVRLAELRIAQRKWLGHARDDQPLIATGHQTELYHAGVWAKDVLINAIARNAGGQAWHLGVDTDTPRHLHLRWPGASLPITDDPALGIAPWTELLAAPTPAHVTELENALKTAKEGWDFEPLAGEFLSAMKRLVMDQPSLCSALTNAIHQIDWRLGLRHHALLMSPAWFSPPYLVFVHHVLARAGEFAAKYNGSLAAYRREEGITTAGRPMPDLQIAGDRVEGALWVDDLARQTRRRLVLERVEDRWRLGERGFVFDPSADGFAAAERLAAFLRERGLRITPRALTLTMFFRLMLADQFVHGIGGARYDRVTDRIIESFVGIEPPRFCVTTATLYFPAARGQKRVSLRPLLQEGRRLLHGSFSREKRETAVRIAQLPRGSREREELFYQMHAKLAQQAASPRIQEWNRRLEEASREQMRQKALFDRELFFAIQPAERLKELIERYEGEFIRA